jgi:hypothetical protein
MSVVSGVSGRTKAPAFQQYTFSDEFINDVNQFVEYEEKIDSVEKALDVIKDKQKGCKDKILTYMKLNSIPSCPLTNGKAIYLIQKKEPGSVSKRHIYERLKQCMGSDYEKIIKFVEDPTSLPVVEKEKIVVK